MSARRVVATAVVAALAAPACGGGDEAGSSASKAKAEDKKAEDKKKAAKKAKAKKKPARGAEAISFIPTLEQVVPSAERDTIRTTLTDEAFLADPEGASNRDPFRSYVLPQVQVTIASTTTIAASSPTERCKQRDLVAPSYSVASLTLVGILRRGAKWYGLLRGPDRVGYSVELGNCVGRERAQVAEFSNNLVEAVVYPEPVPGAAPPEPSRHRWVLYEEQLTNSPDEVPDLATRPAESPPDAPSPTPGAPADPVSPPAAGPGTP